MLLVTPFSGLYGVHTRRPCRSRVLRVSAVSSTVEPGALIFVAGASGGVGQLVTAKLAERGYRVRALTRSSTAPPTLQGASNVEVVQGDCRNADTLRTLLGDAVAVICCTGTTAFPSARWKDDNGPEQTDYVGVRNLITACDPASVGRFVLLSSAGVERQGSFPYIILNAFGVLKWKRKGEEVLEASGLPYTILRPGRLTDGPYTSYDLNTLLQATSGTRQAVTVSPQDTLDGETSRIAVAEAAVQCLALPGAVNKAYSLTSVEGEGPGTSAEKWKALLV